MKNKKSLFILMMGLCAFDDVANGAYVQLSDEMGDFLDDYEDLLDEEELDDELIALPKILLIPPFEQENGLDLSRLRDRRVGDLGGGAVVSLDSRLRTNLVHSEMNSDSSDLSTPNPRVTKALVRSDELSMSDFNLEDKASEHALSPQNEITPESPNAKVDTKAALMVAEHALFPQNEITTESPIAIFDARTALLVSTGLKLKMLLSTDSENQELVARIEELVKRINRIDEMLLTNICSLQWFNREIERIKFAFEQL